MKMIISKAFGLAAAVLIASSAGNVSAEIMTTFGTAGFGATGGVAVQFDATPVSGTASGNIAVTDLVAGTTYSVDSISLQASNQALDTTPYYLGVYTSFGPAVGDTPGPISSPVAGFQGVSDQAIAWSSVADNASINFTFTGITVTAGNDLSDLSDELYFVLQDGTSAITELPAIANNTTGIRRLANGADVDSRVGIIQIPNSAGAGIRADRAPNITVGFSEAAAVIPEPSSFALICMSGVFAATRRRKK